jgi:competence protein ComEA
MVIRKWMAWIPGAILPAFAVAGPVDINSADAETLARELNGVGLAKAEAIVAWREAHGPFTAPESLLEVKGFGPALLEKNLENIRLEETGGS